MLLRCPTACAPVTTAALRSNSSGSIASTTFNSSSNNCNCTTSKVNASRRTSAVPLTRDVRVRDARANALPRFQDILKGSFEDTLLKGSSSGSVDAFSNHPYTSSESVRDADEDGRSSTAISVPSSGTVMRGLSDDIRNVAQEMQAQAREVSEFLERINEMRPKYLARIKELVGSHACKVTEGGVA